jgi:hypothetical protein
MTEESTDLFSVDDNFYKIMAKIAVPKKQGL